VLWLRVLSRTNLAYPSLLCAIPFRINTCESVSKQTTLTSFRINTCEKHREGGGIVN